VPNSVVDINGFPGWFNKILQDRLVIPSVSAPVFLKFGIGITLVITVIVICLPYSRNYVFGRCSRVSINHVLLIVGCFRMHAHDLCRFGQNL
jgi:hypothetical protein